jgi:hypothetical protein
MNRRVRSVVCGGCLVWALLATLLVLVPGEPGPAEVPRLPAYFTVLFAAAVSAGLVLALGTARVGAPEKAGEAWGWIPECAVASLVLVGLALRLAHVERFGLCNDETLFVFAANHESIGETWRDSLTHFHPPTNSLLLHYLLKVSWHPTWIRLPAILGGTLAIGCTYLFVRSLFGRMAGLLAALFVTFSPNLILLSQVARNYSPSLPFFLLSLYCLSRYVQERRQSLLYGFALFEFAAVLWHYGLLPALLGANLVLFAVLLRARAPMREWLHAVVAQIPVAAVYAWAVLFHLPLTQEGQRAKVVGYMAEEFHLDALNPGRQLVAIMRYLVADYPDALAMGPTLLFLVSALLACVMLIRRGMGWQVGLCVAFLPFAYLFAFGFKLLPFGGTRHSFYVFPFLFALVGAAGALAVGGVNAGSASGAGRREWWRVAVPAMLCVVFVYHSLWLYADVTPYHHRQLAAHREREVYYKAKFYKAVELPTRIDDLERLEQSLLRHTGPGDLVVTSFFTMLILQAQFGDPPQSIFFDLEQEIEFSWHDRRIVYVPEGRFGFSPDDLMVAVEAVAQKYGLADDDAIWVALAGWEVWNFLWWGIRDAHPETLIATPAVQESRETLFGLRVGPARAVAEELRQAKAEAALTGR